MIEAILRTLLLLVGFALIIFAYKLYIWRLREIDKDDGMRFRDHALDELSEVEKHNEGGEK